MADYTSLAVHDVRNYMWAELKLAGLLQESDYYVDGFDTPLVPIIPTQQVPEFNNNLPGRTYLVYDYQVLPSDSRWWVTHEIMNIKIVSNNHDKITTITNFLYDLFRRYGASIRSLIGGEFASENFMFKYSSVHNISSPEPFKNEGGLMVGQIDIMYCYIRRLNEYERF
jgi:hypothetical protein